MKSAIIILLCLVAVYTVIGYIIYRDALRKFRDEVRIGWRVKVRVGGTWMWGTLTEISRGRCLVKNGPTEVWCDPDEIYAP